MKCLRCKIEMKHYKFNHNLGIYGASCKPNLYSPETQYPHNPHSVYVCDNCGCVEFSTKYCEDPDI